MHTSAVDKQAVNGICSYSIAIIPQGYLFARVLVSQVFILLIQLGCCMLHHKRLSKCPVLTCITISNESVI